MNSMQKVIHKGQSEHHFGISLLGWQVPDEDNGNKYDGSSEWADPVVPHVAMANCVFQANNAVQDGGALWINLQDGRLDAGGLQVGGILLFDAGKESSLPSVCCLIDNFVQLDTGRNFLRWEF